MPLPRIELSGRVGDQVFAAMHSAILSGELAVGDRLRIRDLAEELGTSVMPVREAIRRLEEIGLAESLPYRGAVVRGFTHTELLELYSTRRLLEIEATRLGATRVSDEDLASMRKEYAAMETAVADGDSLEYLDSDERFLAILYRAADNSVLVELIQALWNRCRTYKILGARQAFDTAHPAELLTWQEQLLEAASEHDETRATTITAASLDAAIDRIRASMNDA
ncbi:GntR family transcriptional regulator [Nocardioides sp. NPDC057577]|uniref:GntR family transcriptional regulator n=1 Tax=Nocardioides sp. NPDC057577 TaxID=3346171 RepID=UPI003672BFC9